MNLFEDLPEDTSIEHFQTLLERAGLKIERIVSCGQASPSDFWYDQEQDEWVLLVRGSAVLQFQDRESVYLEAGSYCFVPAHLKHRVSEVSMDAVWLAIFF